MKAAVGTSTGIDELLITGYEGPLACYAVHLSATGAKIIRPSAGEDGEEVVGEAFERATNAFALIRDLMNDIVKEEPAAGRASDGLTALSDPANVKFELVDDGEGGAGLGATLANRFLAGLDDEEDDATRPGGSAT